MSVRIGLGTGVSGRVADIVSPRIFRARFRLARATVMVFAASEVMGMIRDNVDH